MIQKIGNFLKTQITQVDGVTITVGAVILVGVLVYLIFFRK